MHTRTHRDACRMYREAKGAFIKAAEGFGQALGAMDALTVNSLQWLSEMEMLLDERVSIKCGGGGGGLLWA